MRLYIAATGSAANTYILSADDGESVIIDTGAALKDVLPHVPDVRRVACCLVTHEHADHARHWQDYAKRGIPVCMSAGTARMLGATINSTRELQPVTHGGFTVMPFKVEHDAAEPYGFLIRYNSTGELMLYATDTYYLRYTFPNVNYWLVECNYCEDLIGQETDVNLRKRLKESHMSLRRLSDALAANDLTEASQIVLVHLSDQRSDERRMVRTIAEATGVDTVAASAGMEIKLSKTPF